MLSWYAATDWSIPYNWIRFVSSILHAMQAILSQLCQAGIREHDIAVKTLFLWDMDDLWLQVSARRDRCVNKPAITVGEIWNRLKCTVDGRNPARFDMENLPLFTGFYIYIRGGAGFLPSTVFKYIETHWTALFQSWLLGTWRWRLFWAPPRPLF